MNDVLLALEQWRSCRVAVVGDFMLDRYTFGNADRLSPDAPVPVLAVVREENRPGGASNVALCIRAMGCQVTCLGCVGNDPAGSESIDQLSKAGCDTQGMILSTDRTTTVKQNIIGLAQHRHPQKMFRIDYERCEELTAKLQKQLLSHARKALRACDVLCLEDYNKGVLTPSLCATLIELAQSKGIKVIVDPAAIRDYAKYRGATAITPNRMETVLATLGIDTVPHDTEGLSRLGRQLLLKNQLQVLVMTLDKQGALLIERGRKTIAVPTRARQVYDVTGAGDVFVAAITCAIGNALPWPMAVQLANYAAGLKVERFGVTPIHLHEIRSALHHEHSHHRGKLRQLDDLLAELARHRNDGRRIVFTNGCFDILHAGHVALLRYAKSQGDILVVGLNSDASIRRLKGADRPINQEYQRIATLSEIQCVDHLLVFDDETPLRLIEAIRPDVLVKGADYKESKVVGGKFVASYGGRLALAPLVPGQSTTSILQKLER
ncbi:MAG: D-glycero-beta-D-manno-heptose 1-phosphate adenylyltransferase [Planctomycetota bacterium]|nr:D-glycero-beta-D-manno-heptose 1-phosphate adenylyltransferase [Planctomycetota bacterium]